MTPAYPIALVPWRGVRVVPALAAALDAADLARIRPSGPRSGIRTRLDMAMLYPAQPGRLSIHEYGAIDLSPSKDLTDAQVGPLNPAPGWQNGSTSGRLWRPVKDEPWHVQLRSPWDSLPTPGVRVTCGVAELGPAWWVEAGRPATDWPRAAVLLAQGYLWRLSYLGVRGVDGLWGPGTVAALTAALPTWAPIAGVTETILLALAEACAERGV